LDPNKDMSLCNEPFIEEVVKFNILVPDKIFDKTAKNCNVLP